MFFLADDDSGDNNSGDSDSGDSNVPGRFMTHNVMSRASGRYLPRRHVQ